MFEVLTVTEAATLKDMLIAGYRASREVCQEINGWKAWQHDRCIRIEYDRDLNRQAAMRCELTALCAQLDNHVVQ